MIDRQSESLMPLKDVPGHIESITGRRISMSTVHRWVREGLHGVYLETLYVGGCQMTSAEALVRFDEGVTLFRIDSYKKLEQPASKAQALQASQVARNRLGL